MTCRTKVVPEAPQIVARIELREAPGLKVERVIYAPRDNGLPTIIVYRPESP